MVDDKMTPAMPRRLSDAGRLRSHFGPRIEAEPSILFNPDGGVTISFTVPPARVKAICNPEQAA
jgi:hypothetical protein